MTSETGCRDSLYEDRRNLEPNISKHIVDVFNSAQIAACARNTIKIRSGFPDIDAISNGINPGDLIIFAGHSSIGKTALALNITNNVAHSGTFVDFISFDENEEDLARCLVAIESRIELRQLQKGRLSSSSWHELVKTSEKLGSHQIWIDNIPKLSFSEICVHACLRLNELNEKYGLLIIDGIEYEGMCNSGNVITEEYISFFFANLKHLAVLLQIPIIVTLQIPPRCDQNQGAPSIIDIPAAKEIDRIADKALILNESYAEEHLSGSKNIKVVDLCFVKNKHGETGTVKLVLNTDTLRFENFADPGSFQCTIQ